MSYSKPFKKNIENKTNDENMKQNKVCFETGCKTKTKEEKIKIYHIRNTWTPNQNSFSTFSLHSTFRYIVYIDIFRLSS